MKKSTLMLIIGIVLVLAGCVIEGCVWGNVLDIQGVWGIEHVIALVAEVIAFAAGIILIVVSRKEAKKQK